ncbi:hypothetical protein ACFOY2_47045 [Nonomuraea purpurea]|uniref:Uncharacterized protein n=1 Tax=Nonomuraea purpurea TaxID=1849276 RepID=A0ABV8GRK1_9ACTN
MRNHRYLGALVIALGVITTSTSPAAAEPTPSAPPTAIPSPTPSDPPDAPEILVDKGSKCTSPKGKKFNVSYKTGIVSTTFYFNNHCKQRRSFKVMGAAGQKPPKFGTLACISVNAGTKGRKKVGHAGFGVTHITFVKKC